MLKQHCCALQDLFNRLMYQQPWTLTFILWIIIAQGFALTLDPKIFLLGLALAILIYLIGRSSESPWMKRGGLGPFLFLGFILSFALRWHIALQAQVKVYQIFIKEKQGVRPLTLKGQIDEDFSFRINKPLRQDEQSWFLIPFRLDDGPRIELGMSSEQWERVKHAPRFEVTGQPMPLRSAANPCSYEAHLVGAGRGIYLRFNVMSCRPLKGGQAQRWMQRTRDLRERLFHGLAKQQGRLFAGFVVALLTGDRRFLDPQIYASLQRLGLAFCLSSTAQDLLWIRSGLPSLIEGFSHKWRAVMRFFILAIFTLLLGGSIGLYKSLMIQGIYTYGRLWEKPLPRLHVISFVGFVFLCYRPSLAVHPGFLMSLGISFILSRTRNMQRVMDEEVYQLKRRISSKDYAKRKIKSRFIYRLKRALWLRYLMLFLGIPHSRLTIFMLPILLILRYGIGLILVLGSFRLCLGERICQAILNVGYALRYADYRLMLFDGFMDLSFAFLFILDLMKRYVSYWKIDYFLETLRKWSLILGLGLACLFHFYFFPATEELRLTVFSVGSADMILLEVKDQSFLIDTGETQGHAKIVDQYLRSRRRRGLDAVLLTHEDQDHSGGLLELLELVPVKKVITPLKRELDLKAYENLRLEVSHPLEAEKAPWHYVIFPGSEDDSENDRSLVLLLEGPKSILLTGDIEAKREAELIEVLPKIDLLKVPHHGSKTSSSEAFLRATSPDIGIISLGPKHGHPHAEVLERYQALGIPLYRTDLDGAVSLRIKKEESSLNCRYTRKNKLGFLTAYATIS